MGGCAIVAADSRKPDGPLGSVYSGFQLGGNDI
jgi:hypothetical protein